MSSTSSKGYIETDGFSFDFTDAIEVFVFDETDRNKPTFHGLPMKGVDIIAELNNAYLFVELKDYDDQAMYQVSTAADAEEKKERQGHFKFLKNYLKYKFRDTFLYRYAEQKDDKPIYYICLLTFDHALNGTMQKALISELPVGKKSKRWTRELARSCQVMNLEKWNESFPKWPAKRLTS